MSYYKAVNATQLDADMTSVADAIRAKSGGTEELAWPDGFESAVNGIDLHSAEDAILQGTLTEYTNDRVTEIRRYGFGSYTELKSISCANVVTTNGYAFNGCTGLETVDLPKVQVIGEYTFNACSSLTELEFPSLETFGVRGLANCSSLVKLKLPYNFNIMYSRCAEYCKALKIADMGGCRNLQANAFLNCTSLVALVFRNNTDVCSMGNSVTLSGTPIAAGTGYVYVPSVMFAGYTSSTNWSAFADQVRVLEDYTVDGTIAGELDLEKMGVTL